MSYGPFARRALAAVALIALLGVMRYAPWSGAAPAHSGDDSTNPGRERLTVGFLPVT